MTLSRYLFKEVVLLLEPHVESAEQRRDLFIDAFYGEAILKSLDWKHSASTFARHAVETLDSDQFRYCGGERQHSIERLLLELYPRTETHVQRSINECIKILHADTTQQHQKTHELLQRHPVPYPPTTAENVPDEKLSGGISWKLSLRTVAVLIFLVSIIWIVFDPGFEPLATMLGSLGAILPTLGNTQQPYIGDQRRSWFKKRKDNRTEILDRLQQSWIEGVLYTALRDVKEFNIGTSLKTDALLRHKNVGIYPLRSTSEIWNIYQDFDGRLLILGAPGAGKTILLLQLAEMLLKDARANEKARIPVVFNLASWSRDQKMLDEWLLDEFNTFYRVHRKLAGNWLSNSKLIVMLDGLDEVKEEVRPKCVEYINTLRGKYSSVRFVVCSRLKDYNELPAQLNLDGAITVQPLLQTEVDAYLLAQGESLVNLRSVIAQDDTLRDMSTTPFLLNTMIYTYSEESAKQIGIYGDPSERRQKMFEKYIERRLDDKPSPYGYEHTLKYLRWLARKMQAYTQTVYRTQDINAHWLDDDLKYNHRFLLKITSFLFHSASFPVVSLLRISGRIPWNVERFLHSMTERHILRPLSGGHVFVHRYLLESLAGLDEIRGLIKQLQNKETYSHARASLLNIGTPIVGPLLHSSVEVSAYVPILQEIGSSTMQPIMTILTNKNKILTVRLIAAEALLHVGDIRTIDAWVTVLTDKDQTIRSIAAQALSQFADRQAVAPLCLALNYVDAWAMSVIVKLLGNIGDARAIDALTPLLKHDNDELRVITSEALGKIGDERAIDPLVYALMDTEIEIRDETIIALNRIEASPIPSLIAALKHSKWELRVRVAEALGDMKDTQTTEPLIALLSDKEDRVRCAAAEALGKIGDKRAVEPLIAILKYKADWVRLVACVALGQIGDKRAVEPLIAALRDKDDWVRQVAYEALDKIVDESDVDLLVELFKDKDDWIQQIAVEILAKFKDTATIETLVLMLEGKDFNVLKAVIKTLSKIDEVHAIKGIVSQLNGLGIQSQIFIKMTLEDINTAFTLEIIRQWRLRQGKTK